MPSSLSGLATLSSLPRWRSTRRASSSGCVSSRQSPGATAGYAPPAVPLPPCRSPPAPAVSGRAPLCGAHTPPARPSPRGTCQPARCDAPRPRRSRELELDAFKLQAERSIQDAAEARAKRESLERAIAQYTKILDAIGLGVDTGAGASADAARQSGTPATLGAARAGGLPATLAAALPVGQPTDDSRGHTSAEQLAHYAAAPPRLEEPLTVHPALPAHLLQLAKFVLITDEGAVAVRARLNGTVAYLKRQVAMQLHISPRLALSISLPSSDLPLNDDAIIAPYAESRGQARLLLSAAPRPLSDFFPGSAELPELRQVRVRPTVGGVPENTSVIVRNVKETTTVRELQAIVARQYALLPLVTGVKPDKLHLYFSPVFITPDVLLGRADRQKMASTQTLMAAQVIDDDILYLAVDGSPA